MKKQIGIFLTVIIATLLVIGCTNNSDDASQANVSITAVQVANFAQSGEWRITYFYDTEESKVGLSSYLLNESTLEDIIIRSPHDKLDYIDKEFFEKVYEQSREVERILVGFMKSLKL